MLSFAMKKEYNRIEKEFIAVLYYGLYTNFEYRLVNGSAIERQKLFKEQEYLAALIKKNGIKIVRSYNSGISVLRKKKSKDRR